MRKVVLYIAMSLDGYIADSKGGINWLGGQDPNAAQGDGGYSEFVAGIDSIVMGYTTYHQVTTELVSGAWPYAEMQSYVLTHRQLPAAKDVTFTDQSAVELIEKLRQQPGKAIWILGGASIVKPLVAADCIDEYHLTIMPILLGTGIRLFEEQQNQIPLRLISSTAENGILDCVYHRR